MERKEFNIACGEFLGWHIVSIEEFKKLNEGDWPKEKLLRCVEHLKFDSDWNWIMLVLKKIEDWNYSVETSNIGAENYVCYIRSGGHTAVFSYMAKEKIDAVIDAINRFFIWYDDLINLKNG